MATHKMNLAVCGRNDQCRRSFIASMKRITDTKGIIVYWDISLPKFLDDTSTAQYYKTKQLYSYDILVIVSNDTFEESERNLASEAERWRHPFFMVLVNVDMILKEIANAHDKSMAESASIFRLQLQESLPSNITSNHICCITCSALGSTLSTSCYNLERNGFLDDSLFCMDEASLLIMMNHMVEMKPVLGAVAMASKSLEANNSIQRIGSILVVFGMAALLVSLNRAVTH